MIRFVLILSIFMLCAVKNTAACEIEFEIIKGEKEKYSNGDELVIKVTILLTHKNCPEGTNRTFITTEGIEIIGATKWVTKGSTTFERKFKLKVTNNKNNSSKFEVTRKCEKDGGHGILILQVK